jgi:hypothetical protein
LGGAVEAIWSTLIAVAGTLLGSASTYLFQRASANRADQATRIEQRRQERLAMYAEFVGAATALRASAYDRWHRHQEDPDGPSYLAARDDYYQSYERARSAYTKLRLLTSSQQLVERADATIEQATQIKDADTEADRAARGGEAKRALDAFLNAASADLR